MRQQWGENLPEVIHARKNQQQTLSEPLFPESNAACEHSVQIENTLKEGRSGSGPLLRQHDR